MATQETFEPGQGASLGQGDSLGAPSGDRELAISFQRGDRGAYESIYQRYAARVNGVCLRMLADPQDAQDAAQETFLRVYQALPRFNGRYHLGAWINRIATNVCLDHLRARRRSPADAAPNEVLEDVVDLDAEEGPEDVMLRSDEGARVKRTLARLTPLQRTAILMRDFEGRSYTDIASYLGVSETRARVLLHRARKGFRRSWSSGWIILGLPGRLLDRVRRVRAPMAEQVAYATNAALNAGGAAATAPAASCAQALHGCGGVVSERVAAAATAAIVGLAAAGGAGAAGGEIASSLARPEGQLRGVTQAFGQALTTVTTRTGRLVVAATVVDDVVAPAHSAPDDPEAPPPSDDEVGGETDQLTAAGPQEESSALPPEIVDGGVSTDGSTIPTDDDPFSSDDPFSVGGVADTPEAETQPAPEPTPTPEPSEVATDGSEASDPTSEEEVDGETPEDPTTEASVPSESAAADDASPDAAPPEDPAPEETFSALP